LLSQWPQPFPQDSKPPQQGKLVCSRIQKAFKSPVLRSYWNSVGEGMNSSAKQFEVTNAFSEDGCQATWRRLAVPSSTLCTDFPSYFNRPPLLPATRARVPLGFHAALRRFSVVGEFNFSERPVPSSRSIVPAFPTTKTFSAAAFTATARRFCWVTMSMRSCASLVIFSIRPRSPTTKRNAPEGSQANERRFPPRLMLLVIRSSWYSRSEGNLSRSKEVVGA
jgi:hypothetical protein